MNLFSVLGLCLLGAMQVASGGCSSSSELYGGGGAESFCAKWVGAHCRSGPTKEQCMEEWTGNQARCRDETNALMRCATLEANIACETGSGQPRIVGCAPRQAAQFACLSCFTVCKSIADAACSAGPTLEECQAACAGTTCANLYQRFVDCRPGPPSCTSTGGVSFDSSCSELYFQLSNCVSPGAPFFVSRPPADGGLEASPDGGFGGLGP